MMMIESKTYDVPARLDKLRDELTTAGIIYTYVYGQGWDEVNQYSPGVLIEYPSDTDVLTIDTVVYAHDATTPGVEEVQRDTDNSTLTEFTNNYDQMLLDIEAIDTEMNATIDAINALPNNPSNVTQLAAQCQVFRNEIKEIAQQIKQANRVQKRDIRSMDVFVRMLEKRGLLS